MFATLASARLRRIPPPLGQQPIIGLRVPVLENPLQPGAFQPVEALPFALGNHAKPRQAIESANGAVQAQAEEDLPGAVTAVRVDRDVERQRPYQWLGDA